MGSGVTKGGRDFYLPGTHNVMCAYCGRKRKANELVRDDQFARGQYVCFEHRDMRHPQEFARGIKEDMTAPFVQPLITNFTSLAAGFPLTINPTPIVLLSGTIDLLTETTNNVIFTESGIDIVTETAFTATPIAVLPLWISQFEDVFGVYVTSILWAWISGGSGIQISDTTSLEVELQALTTGLSGVLGVTVVNSLGQTASATANVNS